MKVYVFTHHAASEYEFLGVVNQVFSNKEDATKAFNEWKADEMPYVKKYDMVIGTDEPDHFEAYEDGRYQMCHTEGFINEYEVQ